MDDYLKQLIAERERRKQAKASIVAYIHYLHDAGLPDFEKQPARHHHKLAEILENLADPDHGDDRAAISLPPGSAKSFYSSIVFPTWLLAKDPTKKVLCISNSETLAEDFSRRRRQIMLTPEWQTLAETNLLSDAKSLGFQGVKEGGGIYARGAGSTISGLRSDCTISDDLIVGHEQAQSMTQLDKLWSWYLSEARSRSRPGCIELMIGTRWALRDPIGRVVRLTEDGKENWHYFRVPMICDDTADPIGRKIGEKLWPQWYTAQLIKDAQRDPLWWKTLYQQRPASGTGTWVSDEHIHIANRRTFPPVLKRYIGIDLALSVQRGDYTVFVVIAVDTDKRIYVEDLYRRQVDTGESAKALVSLCEQYQPASCWIDNDPASKVWKRLVRESAREAGTTVPLRLSRLGNRCKESRAAPLRALFMSDRITLAKADWTPVLQHEIDEFPAGRHDDCIDALGLPAKELHLVRAPSIPFEKRRDMTPIKASFQKMADGQVKTCQTLDQLYRDRAETLSMGRGARITRI